MMMGRRHYHHRIVLWHPLFTTPPQFQMRIRSVEWTCSSLPSSAQTVNSGSHSCYPCCPLPPSRFLPFRILLLAAGNKITVYSNILRVSPDLRPLSSCQLESSSPPVAWDSISRVPRRKLNWPGRWCQNKFDRIGPRGRPSILN